MERNKNFGKIILGIAVILVGGVLLMDNLELTYLPLKQYIFSWKTLLIVIGLAMLASRKNLAGGIILISLGVVFWLPAIFNYQIALNQILWPSLLIAVGIIFLLKSGRRNKLHGKHTADLNPDTEETRVEIIE